MAELLPTQALQGIFDQRYFRKDELYNPLSFQGDWQASTTYEAGWSVTVSGEVYVALARHTAGETFQTDLSAGKWVLWQGVTAQMLADPAAGRGSDLMGVPSTLDFVGDTLSEVLVEIRNLFQDGALAYATQADLYADLAHNEGTAAIVTNDPTPANNGFYRKAGASGSGSWVQSADRVSDVIQQVATLSDDLVGMQGGVNILEHTPAHRVITHAALNFTSQRILAGNKVSDRLPSLTWCGWASAINYSDETFDVVAINCTIEDDNVPVRVTIRSGADFNIILAEVYQTITASGEQRFVLPEKLTTDTITTAVFWVAIESATDASRIAIPTIETTSANADSGTYTEKYRNQGNPAWHNADPGVYPLMVRCYDSMIDHTGFEDLSQSAASAELSKKSGRLLPAVTEQRITQTAEKTFTVSGAYSVKNWRVQQNIQSDKIINAISIPLARDFYNNGTFTESVLVKIGHNDRWIYEYTIPVEDLAPYNALLPSSSKELFDYYIDIPDTLLQAGDHLFIAWECGPSDLMSLVYGNNPVPDLDVEGQEGLCIKSLTAGLVAAMTAPQVITTQLTFYLRARSYYRRYIYEYEPDSKAELSLITPPKLYTVKNDLITGSAWNGRMTAIPLYIDHCMNGVTSEPDIVFDDNKSDMMHFFSPMDDDDGENISHGATETYTHTVNIYGGRNFNNTSFSIVQKSTKESVGIAGLPKVMAMGDSVTAGYLSSMSIPENQAQTYWAVIKEEFEKSRIDKGDSPSDHNCLMVGRNVREWELTYGGITARAMRACAEAHGGWDLSDHLHCSRSWTENVQGLWDLLGLGNGTGTDYIGSDEQLATMNTTPEGKYAPTNTAQFIAYVNSELSGSAANYAEAVALLAAAQANPENPFYDKTVAQVSNHAFSLATYLARYQTLANDGVTRLIAGQTAGTEVTDVDAYDVCLPSHFIIQHSHNDGNAIWIAENYRILTDAIKAEYTANGWGAVDIGISIIDHTGTYYPSRYPEFDLDSVALWNYSTGHSKFYENFQRIKTEFWVDSANEDTERIYLLPSGFVQPTAWAMPFRAIQSPEFVYTGDERHRAKKMWGVGPDWHPNGIAHRVWGQEMYAWIRYTLSL